MYTIIHTCEERPTMQPHGDQKMAIVSGTEVPLLSSIFLLCAILDVLTNLHDLLFLSTLRVSKKCLAIFPVLRSYHFLAPHCRSFFTCIDECMSGSQHSWCLIIDFPSFPIFFVYGREFHGTHTISGQTSPRRSAKSGTEPLMPARTCGTSVDATKELVKNLVHEVANVRVHLRRQPRDR